MKIKKEQLNKIKNQQAKLNEVIHEIGVLESTKDKEELEESNV